MTTPNSTPTEPTVDLNEDAMASEDTAIGIGEMIVSEVDYSGRPARAWDSRCNVGRTEQKFRIGTGAALLAAAAFAPVSRGWRIGFAALGAAELITGTTRYCPVSQALGINTCRGDEA